MLRTCLILIAWPVLALIALGQSTTGKPSNGKPARDERQAVGVIDPRIEIMFALQMLSGYEETGLISSFNTKYKAAVKEHFAPFREHQAVKLFKERMYEGFNFGAPLEFMLCHDSLDQMKPLRPYSPAMLKKLAGQAKADAFRAAMAKFAQDTKAAEFYQKQQPLFEAITTRARRDLQLPQMIEQLEQFTGLPLPQAGVIFMPLGHEGGFGLHLTGVPGRDQAVSLIGPLAMEDAIPVYRPDTSTKLLIWHELAHPIINPLLERDEKALERSASAFKPIRKRLEAEACGDWPSCVKETMVRAVVIHLAEKHLGAEAALAQRVVERRHGWVYVDEFLPMMGQLDRDRTKGFTFAKILPSIIERLDFISKSMADQQ